MTIRIPIIQQSTTTSFVPQQSVEAIQVADPRGKALQDLGKSVGDFGEALDKRDKAQKLKDLQNSYATKDQEDFDSGPAGHAATIVAAGGDGSAKFLSDGTTNSTAADGSTPPPFNPVAWQYGQRVKAQTFANYANCVGYAADLSDHLTGATPAAGGNTSGAGNAPGFSLTDLLKSPNPFAQFTDGLMQRPSGSLPAGLMPGAAGGDSSQGATPAPTDASAHGTAGAWFNGYDIVAKQAVAAAPDARAAAAIAAQCNTDRASGGASMVRGEAQANLQQRQAGFLNAASIIATKRLSVDPQALPQMLAFADKNMITRWCQ
jgi:hypothetical protein